MHSINSPKSHQPSGGYSQAVEVVEPKRTLYISGQIPMSANGDVPGTFEQQAMLVWSSIANQLQQADMTFDNLVKHTTFLSNRKYCEENSKIRQQLLGDRRPALTVVIAEIYDSHWLLEVEAIAVA